MGDKSSKHKRAGIGRQENLQKSIDDGRVDAGIGQMVNQEAQRCAGRRGAQLLKAAGQLDGLGDVLAQLLDDEAE